MATNETLKSKREEANRLVANIKNQAKIVEDNVLKSKELVSKIKSDSKESTKLNANLNRIITITEETIKRFRVERDKISKILTQVNNFHENKYLPLVSKIEDEHTGFKARLKQGTQFKNEILRIKESSKSQYDEVKKYASELRKANRELTSIDNSIRKLFENSKNKNASIDNINIHVSKLDKEISIRHEKLLDLFNQSKENEKSIDQLLKDSTTEYNNIVGIKEDSKKLLREIQDIYEIAAETGLSGEFDRRRKHLKELLGTWEKRIFITTLVLLGMIIMMFVGQLWLYGWDMTNHTFDINFYIRFLIASPVVYYLYFCSSQHSQAKKLHDRYSFKTTLAMSIKHHIKLLTQHEKFEKDDRINRILDFVLEGFQKIYSEPHTNDDYKLKLKLANMEMDIEKKLIESISKITGNK